jgi:hypothetical protein
MSHWTPQIFTAIHVTQKQFFWQYWGSNSGPHTCWTGAITAWASLLALLCVCVCLCRIFQDRVSRTICPDWLRTSVLLISAFWVAGITGMRPAKAIFQFLKRLEEVDMWTISIWSPYSASNHHCLPDTCTLERTTSKRHRALRGARLTWSSQTPFPVLRALPPPHASLLALFSVDSRRMDRDGKHSLCLCLCFFQESTLVVKFLDPGVGFRNIKNSRHSQAGLQKFKLPWQPWSYNCSIFWSSIRTLKEFVCSQLFRWTQEVIEYGFVGISLINHIGTFPNAYYIFFPYFLLFCATGHWAHHLSHTSVCLLF